SKFIKHPHILLLQITLPDQCPEFFPCMIFLIFLLADLLQTQILLPVFMYGIRSGLMMAQTEITLKTIRFTHRPVRSKIDMVLLYLLDPVISLQHAKITSLVFFLLQDALCMLLPLFPLNGALGIHKPWHSVSSLLLYVFSPSDGPSLSHRHNR